MTRTVSHLRLVGAESWARNQYAINLAQKFQVALETLHAWGVPAVDVLRIGDAATHYGQTHCTNVPPDEFVRVIMRRYSRGESRLPEDIEWAYEREAIRERLGL